MSTVPPQLIIVVCAALGVVLASYIRYKKITHQVLVCPLHANCEVVTSSQFSRFLGVPVELLGIAYYTATWLAYASFILVPQADSTVAALLAIAAAATAFLFSVYLTIIQAVTLRQWCTWCLLSAVLCTIIFFTALWGSRLPLAAVLLAIKPVLVGIHLFGVVAGLGGASIVDFFFFKFLRDYRISHDEAKVLHTLSQVIWFGLAILILTGIGLYLPAADTLNHNPKFLVKVVAAGVITLNGIFLNLFIAPRLVSISFGREPDDTRQLNSWRPVAFASGAISATSWYTAFLLGLLPRSLPIGFGPLLLLYVLALACAVLGSQVVGYGIAWRSRARTATPALGRSAGIPPQASAPGSIGQQYEYRRDA